MKVRTIILLMTVVLLAGCATGFHSMGYTGGYSDIQLGENTFKVSFTGNGYTLQQRALDFALLRSARITLRHGYRYFVVDASESHNRTGFVADNYGMSTFSKPRVTLVISCFSEKPLESGKSIFDARYLEASIRKRYGLAEAPTERSAESAPFHARANGTVSSRSGSRSEEEIQSLIHRVGPRPLRKFIENYRRLYVSNGNQFITDLLTSPWYARFVKDHQRKPVIAILDHRKNSSDTTTTRHVWIPVNGGIRFYFVSQPWSEKDVIQENLLKTAKVGVVIYKHRKFSSGERLFQMKHAASKYIKNPGHLEGADAALILSEKDSQPQPLGFHPEDMPLPVEIANVTPISLNAKLIDIGTDELLWTQVYPLNIRVNETYCHPPGHGLTGTPSFSNSCFSPN